MKTKESGFFDISDKWKINKCRNPHHNPPGYIVIPKGKGYRHICPSCGEEQVIINQEIYF